MRSTFPLRRPWVATAIAGLSLLAVTFASAANYYWDTDGDGTAGFGSATGTWSSAGTGNTWSTSPTGDGIDGGAVADYVTTTADDLFFGTDDNSTSGTVTIDGVVNAKSIYDSTISFSEGTINFGAEGAYTRANNNNGFLPVMTFTGAGTSFTWTARRNFNVSRVDNSNAGSIILRTSPSTPYPYPGRTRMEAEMNLGAPDAPLVFDGGTLRLGGDFPYSSLSALNAAHPITWTADKDAGIDNNSSFVGVFVFDEPIDLGTGAFWSEGNSGGSSQFTVANNWSRLYLTSSTLEVSASDQLGPDTADFVFGSDSSNLSSGTLKIAGTTFSTFGTRSLVVTDTKTAYFEIVEAAHTFTVDQAMTQSTGGLSKTGAGTLALSGTANTYTGATSVDAGTLALVGGTSLDSAVTVSSGAHLGLSVNSVTPATALSSSSSSVNLTNGDVTITNPGAVDGSSDYLLMAAAAGFTFGDIATQLGNTVTNYSLALQNADTELWLVYAPSGTDYATWATGFVDFTDTTENVDFDNGGLESGVEYVLGGDPTDSSDDAGKAPTITDDGTNMIFTFVRDQASIHPDTVVTIEVGTTLGTWTDTYTVAADTAGSTAGVVVTKDTPEVGVDTVTLTVVKAPDDKKFARLNVDVVVVIP